LYSNQQRTVSFIIDNVGGDSLQRLFIAGATHVPWLVGQRVSRINPSTEFPLQADFDIDTTGLKPGTYRLSPHVILESSQVEFHIVFSVVLPPPKKFWWLEPKAILRNEIIIAVIWALALLMNLLQLLPAPPGQPGAVEIYYWMLLLFWPVHIATQLFYRFAFSISTTKKNSIPVVILVVCIGFFTPLALNRADYFADWVILGMILFPCLASLTTFIGRSYILPSRRSRVWMNAILLCAMLPAFIFLSSASVDSGLVIGLLGAWIINSYLLIV
jgi:hypothetical protein